MSASRWHTIILTDVLEGKVEVGVLALDEAYLSKRTSTDNSQ
jgi:hypothetical protein